MSKNPKKSTLSLDLMKDRWYFAWTVRVYTNAVSCELIVKSICSQSSGAFSSHKEVHKASVDEHERSRIFIYTERFERTEAIKKPLRDQVAIFLGTRQGFRTAEISSNRANHYDFDNGNLTVLDSKKHRYLLVVLRPIVATTVMRYLKESGKKNDDLLITALPTAHHVGRKPNSKTRGEGLSDQYICSHIYGKWSLASGSPEPLTPREARAYFCYNTYKKAGLLDTQIEMRHDHPDTTRLYYERITNWADHKATILSGEDSPFSPQSQCACQHAGKCPFFLPSSKVTENLNHVAR